jgi:hypothetical protein
LNQTPRTSGRRRKTLSRLLAMTTGVPCLALVAACANDPPHSPTQAALPAATPIEHERLRFDFETGWRRAYSAETPSSSQIHEFVREGDDINSWKELVTIQNLVKSQYGTSADATFRRLKADVERKCPNLTHWQIVASTPNSVLYEWTAEPCQTWPDTHEIAKIVEGKYNYFVVRYTIKAQRIAEDVRASWLRRISEATIETASW